MTITQKIIVLVLTIMTMIVLGLFIHVVVEEKVTTQTQICHADTLKMVSTVESYKPTGTPPSYARPERYKIRVGNNGKYYVVWPGGTVLDIAYNSPEEAQYFINTNAKESMDKWLQYGGF